MFADNITGEMLFNDPHILSKYLDDISHEIQIPYFQKRGNNFLTDCESTKSFDQEIVNEINKKESQLKLLVDFVGILIDRSQEKMQHQAETIEKVEQDLKETREEKDSLKFELTMIKQNFDTLHDKCKKLETAFTELEESYDRERLASNAKKLEVHILSDIKDKYTEAKDEENKQTLMNMQLSEEKEAVESQCTMLKEENGRLKELIALKELETNSLDQIVEENTKLKVQQERLRRDFELEKEALCDEINCLRESLDITNHQYHKLEQEIKDELSKNPSLREFNNNEDVHDNLNIRLSKVTYQSRVRTIGRRTLESEPYSPDGSHTGRSSSQFLKSFINNDETGLDQYDAMRISLTRGSTRPHSRKPSICRDIERIEEEQPSQYPVKENRTCQVSYESGVSTANTLKLDPTSNNSLNACETNNTINPQESNTSQKRNQAPQIKRRGILEEFYSLTWQSVLMNSSHFNSIAGKIDPNVIYKEMSELDIPFYKWHSWLEDKLKQLYQTQLLPVILEKRLTGLKLKS